MAYLIGARHTLTGSGQVALSTPVGLKLQVPTVPISVDERFGNPAQIYGAGWLTLGNNDGWFAVIPLRHQAQLELGFDPLPTKLGYDLVDGVTVIADELVGVNAAAAAVVDRNPASVGNAVIAWDPAGTATTQAFVYTVPTGRKLLLTSLRVHLSRLGAMPATSAFSARGWIQVDGLNILADAQISAPTLFGQDELNGSLLLVAGQTIRGYYNNSESGGAAFATLAFAGTLFDA